jgi:hypothetical protein
MTGYDDKLVLGEWELPPRLISWNYMRPEQKWEAWISLLCHHGRDLREVGGVVQVFSYRQHEDILEDYSCMKPIWSEGASSCSTAFATLKCVADIL